MTAYKNFPMKKNVSGFTLIELIIGMTLMVLAISFMLAAMLPKEKESADQIHLIRAAEFAQSLMNEITSKAFDHESDLSGGMLRCNETGWQVCTSYDSLGPEGEIRSAYNDVDDFHGLTNFEDALDGNLADAYAGFSLLITVQYDNNYNGIFDSSDTYNETTPNNISLAKLITITVTTPLGTPIKFATYKANYQ